MNDEGVKILQPHRGKVPRCPLCFAEFAREESPLRRARILEMIKQANQAYQLAKNLRDEKRVAQAKAWGEELERSLNAGAAEAYMCRFCKIAISCNDPVIGRWEEVYTKGEKILCPRCDHEMRFFCTSTGYMQAKCPVRSCQTKMETSEPDRKKEDKELSALVDQHGRKVAIPGVDRPIATPEDPSAGQVGAAPDDPNVPKEVFIPMPKEYHA